MPTRTPHIALLIMVKNEKKRLHITLESVKDHVDSIVAYDTGSTDNTIEILREFSTRTGLPLHLKEGEFVDFSTSRNVSLDFADSIPDVDFILLLDTNDELRGGEKLREFAQQEQDSDKTGFLCCQEWWSGKYDKYYNVRFVKARSGWRYRGSVHEYMSNTNPGVPPTAFKVPPDVVLYQDRTQDDDKTGKRFKRDKVLLLKDHHDDPEEPRTLFYLAQTCACLNENDEALYYYRLRSQVEGFQEEKFHAFLRSGELSELQKHDWHTSMTWYIKAFEHSERAEPLIRIAHHYQLKQRWSLAYAHISLACRLPYPDHAILFVDKHAYDYTRWHIMGIVAYYIGEYAQGKEACMKAIAVGLNRDLDKDNLNFYLQKETELAALQQEDDKQKKKDRKNRNKMALRKRG